MPRKTEVEPFLGALVGPASMRPRPDAAENLLETYNAQVAEAVLQ